MKRLTKEERTGATAIALVALLICGGSFLWSRRERGSEKADEIVRSIILASDSTDNNALTEKESDEDADIQNGRKNREPFRPASKKEKKKGKGEGTDKKKKKDSSPSRDFLSDPI